MSEGFFSRWSRRKQETLQGAVPDAETAGSSQAAEPSAAAPTLPTGQDSAARAAEAPAQPLPSLEDVKALTPESDFQPFMQRGVGSEVRNAAMKKLFADPHFNVMDGLDIYIDDYSQPDPLPAGMLQQMASAQFLKLVPDPQAEAEPERRAQDPDGRTEQEPVEQVVAQSPDSSAKPELRPHDHPDLQLQPDPAPSGPEPGPHPR